MNQNIAYIHFNQAPVRNFGIYQNLALQKTFRSHGIISSAKKINLRGNAITTLAQREERKALVISNDKTLQEHFEKRLIQHFNFEVVEFADNKAEVLNQASKKFLWVIVSEDFPELGLHAISRLFSQPSQNLLILIGNTQEREAERLGFDLALRKTQLFKEA